LPTKDEFETLIDAVGGNSVAGTMLKSSVGWNQNRNGIDAYAFTALPAGIKSNKGLFIYARTVALFWSSTAFSSRWEVAYSLVMTSDSESAYATTNNGSMEGALSVRCIMD
jgi:uncharacterized protein (TIGR02145 family)